MTDRKDIESKIEIPSRAVHTSELVVREIQTVLPMTPEELSQLESVARASQDRESEMNRLLARFS